MRIAVALLSLLLFTLPIELRAQTDEFKKTKQSDKNLISIPVAVSDREGHYIPNLKKEDFSIFRDGVKQNIGYFATYDEPVNIALLLDSSGSTDDVLAEIKDAAKEFIELLNPKDKCLIATFDAQVKILNPLTSSHKTLNNSLDNIRSANLGGTVVYRAVEQVAQTEFANVQGRKVIVLLTDGKDFGSAITKEELLGQLEESDILIYTIFYKTGVDSDQKNTAQETPPIEKPKKKKKGYSIVISTKPEYVPTKEEEAEIALREKNEEIEAVDALKKISDTTAGRFYSGDAPKLGEIFKKIGGELRQQYRLGFYSNDAANDAAAHDIIVKVNRPDAVVRFRGTFRAKQL